MPGCKFFRLLILTVLLFSAQRNLYCQETEADIKEKAAQFFEEEKYVEATSLYLRLLALNPRSHDYNFRYGTCLLYNSYKKQDAFRYLNYSVSDPAIDVQAFYFLGKAYHLNYQFNEAIKNYELYKQKSAGKPKASFEVDRQIEMCQNGKRLLTTITDIIVLEKKEFDRKEFFRLYNLENIGGDLIVGAAYQSKVDKKKGHVPLLHVSSQATALYYSSFGESDNGQKDIYIRRKLPDGNWSMPQLVPGNVNSKFDEDFPYMHPGGEYLYFASKGHNSMGGYDIFRSKLNPESGTFGPPENMDFAVSSPDDDIFYVVDSLDQNAYFASARQSNNGKLFVYKVRVDRVPLQLAVIKGNFSSTINPDSKKLSITVTDFASGEKIGVFSTNDRSSYLITLPKGGKYKYEMKVEGKPDIHTYIVNVPFFKEFHPLKQKIVEEKGETGEVVRVIDLFNEAVDDPVGILAEVIKNRSELNPNASQFDMKALDADKENERILAELGFKNATPESVLNQFDELTRKKEQEVKASENLVDGALDKAMEKLSEAAVLQDKAKSQVNKANAAETKQEKYELFEEAKKTVDKVAELKAEAKVLIAFSDSVSRKLPGEKANAAKILEVKNEIRTAVTDGNTGDLKDIIGRNTDVIANASVASEDPVTKLINEKTAVRKEKAEVEQQKTNYSASLQKLEAEIKQLNAGLATAKKKDQPAIQSSIDSKTQELNLVREENTYQDKKLQKLVQKETAIDNKISFLQNVTKVDGKTPVPAATVNSKLAEVDTKNSNTLAAYINQQVNTLKDDPAVKPVSNDMVANGFRNDYESQIDAINNSSDSPVEKKRKRAELDERISADIAAEIAKVETDLAKNPDSKEAIQRKKELTELKQNADASHEKQLAELASESNGSNELTSAASELKKIDPEYEAAIASVSGDEKTVLEGKNKLDSELVTKVESELAVVNEALNGNPADKKLIARKNALEEVKTVKSRDVAQREKQLQLIKSQPAETITAASELKKIDPDYESAVSAVSGDRKTVLEKSNDLDRALVSTIEREIDAVNEEIRSNPSDILKERKKVLEDLLSEKSAAITTREKELKTLTASVPEAISVAGELKRIDPDYENTMNNVSADERLGLEQKNAIDKALIDKIDQQLEAIGEKLADPGSDEQDKVLNERKQALSDLRKEKTAEVAQRDVRLKQLEAETPVIAKTPESERDFIAPDYESQMAAANSGTAESSLSAKNNIDKALLEKIEYELGEVDGQLLRNPENKEAKERKDALEQLKTTTQELVAQRESELEKLRTENQPEPATDFTATVNKVRPSYESNVGKIIAKNPEGKVRETALLKEEQALLTAINKELATADEQALKNPENEGAQAKADQLREVQAIQEAKVNEAQLNLTAAESASIDKNELLADIAPAYKSSDINTESGSEDRQKAIDSESRLQEALTKKESANAKKLAKEFDPKLAAENKVIADLKLESEARKEAIQNPRNTSNEAIAAINNDLGDDAELLMRSKPESIEQAKRIITELKEYENQLDEQLNTLRSENPEDTETINLKDQQLIAVRKRVGIVTADLDAMENYVVPVTAEVEKETALAHLNGREKELLEKKSHPGISGSESKAIAKELKKVQADKEEVEKGVLASKISETDASISEAQNVLSAQANQSELASAVLKSSKTGESSVADKKTSSEKLSAELQHKQEVNTLLTTTADYLQLEKEFTQKGIVTENIPQLEARKRRFLIEIGQLESLGTKLENDPAGGAQLQEIRNQQAAYRNAVNRLDEMIARSKEENKTEPSLVALNSAVSYEEEVALQQKPQYQALVRQQENVKAERQELNQLKRERETLRNAVSAEKNPEKRNALVNALVETESRIILAQRSLAAKEAEMDLAIENSGLPKEKVQNLLARDVPYKAPVQLAEILSPELRTGFNLVAKPETVRKENLPVGLKAPTGLVYRVQVGAYAKALPENLFTEFTPVTGEKLTNGITRYMAGYFGNRLKAVDAQKSIRALGYNDAFVVAYCDGERISIAEARRLEAAGLCVPKNQDSLMMEVVENRIAQLPADSVAKIRPVIKKSDYNKAPGAAPAEAAEERQGLFFTVQIGVYNRPATLEQLRSIQPLITKRLPNGQIRYSSGVFQSVESAKPKRVEAVTRGISDAFITAYYKGERISLSEAKQLLEEQGDGILEKEEITSLKPELFEEARIYASEQPVPTSKTAKQPVQIISSRTYDTYPAEELSRLNAYGSFYYDKDDQHIKSIVYTSASSLPVLTGIPESMDTIFQKSETGSNFEPKLPLVVAEWGGTEINGAMADWLLRTNLNHKAVRTEGGFRIQFEEVQPNEREGLIRQLQEFGAAMINMDESQKEEPSVNGQE